MADSGYDAEVKSIQAFLSMQHPASQPVINPSSIDVSQLEDYVAPRFLRKMRSRVSLTMHAIYIFLVIRMIKKLSKLSQKTCVANCLPEKPVTK